MRARNYNTNTKRASLALIAGAFAGAAGTIIMIAAGLHFDRIEGFRSQDPQIFALAFVVALVVWAIGLVAFGLPLWWLFHRNGYRSRRAAGFLGAGTTAVVVFGLEFPYITFVSPANRADLVDLAALGALAVVGGLVALLIWRIAYRPADERA